MPRVPITVIPAKAGHEVKRQRYPVKHWMPDQVRHDEFAHGYVNAFFSTFIQVRPNSGQTDIEPTVK